MAIIKCKMCGGDLDLSDGKSVIECEYCGTQQTVPTADNEKKMALFSRANRLRLANEFDKAAGIYESIVAEFPEEAEAYWGLVLCRYGIEYVDDPATGKKIPTCHRSSFDSIMEDSDFEQAAENADVVARKVYREEAKTIEEIRKSILEVSSKEEPYDIFICYKETAEDGDRTIDSVIAQDVYDALTEKGYRVFFSRITLEDKLGSEYEPYIFAALNSAKVMLVFGTDYEYFNAVWVKNEWSRFLSLIAAGQKKTLIPCYKNIDAYDMPKEFARLQGQDMGKVGAIQDLLHGIEKIIPFSITSTPQKKEGPSEADKEALKHIKRGLIYLEDECWDDAYHSFEEARIGSDSDETFCAARVGRICAELGISSIEEFENSHPHLPERTNRDVFSCAADTKAGYVMLSQENWTRACEFFDEALEQNPEHAPAYVGKLCAEMGCRNESELSSGETPLSDNKYYKRAIQFADSEYRLKLESYNQEILENSSERRLRRLEEIRRVTDSFKGCISAGFNHTLGLNKNGTVFVAGVSDARGSEVEHWYDLIAVAAGRDHSVGLKADGSVISQGSNTDGQCNTYDWKDIIEISAGFYHTVGLKKDGTVVAVGRNKSGECEVQGWTDIVSISAGSSHTLGLKNDGTVVAVGDNKYGQCNLDGAKDVVMVSAGSGFSVILKADGTVDACGHNLSGECDVKHWKGICMIAAGVNHTVGLTNEGRVLIAHRYVDTGGGKAGMEADKKYFNVSGWHNIVAISARRHTVGLVSNGEVVAVGTDGFLDTKTSTFQFENVGPVEVDLRIQASRKIEQDREKKKQSQQWEKQGLCRYCGGQLGGLFTKKCKQCGKPN